MRHLPLLTSWLAMVMLVGCGQTPAPSSTKSEVKSSLDGTGRSGYDGTGVSTTGAGSIYGKPEPNWRDRQLDNSEYKKGEEFLKSKDYSTAIVCYSKAIEGDSKHYAAYFRRGFCYAREMSSFENWKKAITDFTIVVANAGECPFKKDEIYVSRACTYYNLGGDDNHEKCVADCTEAIRLNSQNAEAYYFRSLSKRSIAGLFGNKDSADRDLAEAQRLQPGIGK